MYNVWIHIEKVDRYGDTIEGDEYHEPRIAGVFPRLSGAEKLRDHLLEVAEVQKRLTYLRKEIEAERISYGEIAELQSLVQYIDPDDALLLQWAGVEEKIR